MSESISLPSPRRRVLGLILALLGGVLTFASLVNGIFTGILGFWPMVPKDMLIDLAQACAVGIVLLYLGARLWSRP